MAGPGLDASQEAEARVARARKEAYRLPPAVHFFPRTEPPVPPDFGQTGNPLRLKGGREREFKTEFDALGNPVPFGTSRGSEPEIDVIRSAFQDRISDRAHPGLEPRDGPVRKALEPARQTGFVLSADIRNSTALMSAAEDEAAFADFLIETANALELALKDNWGIFEKFTGDGVLGFFPLSYSGPDAGFNAVQAAEDCHDAFRCVYSKHSGLFRVLQAVPGLGIGIDYGSFSVAHRPRGVTIIGKPVVYACRLNCAPAGSTYLNHQAHLKLRSDTRIAFSATPVRVPIKHEPEIVAHEARVAQRGRPVQPPWMAPPVPAGNSGPPATVQRSVSTSAKKIRPKKGND